MPAFALPGIASDSPSGRKAGEDLCIICTDYEHAPVRNIQVPFNLPAVRIYHISQILLRESLPFLGIHVYSYPVNKTMAA